MQINNSASEIQVLVHWQWRGDFKIFQFASATRRQKKAEDSIDTFVIASPMASACLGILPRAMIWFLNNWDYFFYLIILFTYETLEMGETEETISPVDHLVLVSSYVFVIAGERITQR